LLSKWDEPKYADPRRFAEVSRSCDMLVMIWNILDRRKRPYRWKRINAIIEAVEHYNSCADADQAPASDPKEVVDYDQRECISVEEAIGWAHQEQCRVTLYLYDDGKRTTTEEHFTSAGNRF